MGFKVHNADFIADKLAAELLPNQEYREVYINAVEAIQRVLATRPDDDPYVGRIEFDIDWHLLAGTLEEGDPKYQLSCADNGDGMSKDQLQEYTATLAVEGAGGNQSLTGNQGMGLKISGPTRHPEGVFIRSLKDGEAWSVLLGRDADGYGFMELGPNGERIHPAPLDSFPDFIRESGSGTVVTFLGKTPDDETFPGSPNYWLFKYLNSRIVAPHDERIHCYARQPSGERENWPQTLEEANSRSGWNLAEVKGTGRVWEASSRDHGTMLIPGLPGQGIPPSKVHWYLFDEGKDPSSRTYAGGSIAVAFQNELHDWRYGGQASATFARAGILYGKSRVGLIVEPDGGSVASDFARAHVLVDGTQVTDHDLWAHWTEYFRAHRPQPILDMMAEEQSRLSVEDPERLKRISKRLADVLSMLRPRRYKVTPTGDTKASGEVTGSGSRGSAPSSRGGTGRTSSGTRPRRGVGALLADVDADGETSTEVYSDVQIEVNWVTEKQAEDMPFVEGNGLGLKDRAAGLVGPSAASAGIVALNRDFRGFQALIAEANKEKNPEGDDLKAQRIADVCEEWVEQKIMETVLSMRQLENGSSWMREHLDAALSPVGLTSAFMADRWHTWNEIKRALGKM